MLKSRWVRIFFKVLLIWFVITVYFYFQHPVIYRYNGINAIIPIGEDQLAIDEISLSNYDEAASNKTIFERQLSWKYKMLEKLSAAPELSPYVFKLMSFYSRPPILKENGILQISGTYISAHSISNQDFDTLTERYDIYTYPGWCSGSGHTKEMFNNAVIMHNSGSFPFKEMNKPFLLTIEDKATGKTTQLFITAQWQKERLIKRNYDEKLFKVFRDYINHLYNENPRMKDGKIIAGTPVLAGKPYQINGNLKWLDVYEDYCSVYQFDAEISEYSEDGKKSTSTSPDKITVYVRKNVDGDYEIISSQISRIKTVKTI